MYRNSAPRPAYRTARPATQAQFNFLKSLIADRVIEGQTLTAVSYARNKAVAGNLSSAEASALIETLKGLPFKTARPAANTPAAQPELGYYVRKDGAAIKVVESKRNAGRRYGLVFTPHGGSRPTWDYVPGAGYSVADLVPMTAADAARIGLAHGYCIECSAKLGPKDPEKPTLSSLVAANIGYGEVCAANNGWPFPKGAKAQREFLAAQV